MMNESTSIALFGCGLAITFIVLITSSQRTFHAEQERALMNRMRRRLKRMLLNQKG